MRPLNNIRKYPLVLPLSFDMSQYQSLQHRVKWDHHLDWF